MGLWRLVLVCSLSASRSILGSVDLKPLYEDDFTNYVLDANGKQQESNEQFRARIARLQEEAPKHKSFLLRQLKYRDPAVRAPACLFLGHTKDRSLTRVLIPIAQSNADYYVRNCATLALGHLGGPQSFKALLSLVSAPYPGLVESAAEGLHRVDPKGAATVLKARIERQDLQSRNATSLRLEMAAYILDSNPVNESSDVLKIVQEIKRISPMNYVVPMLEKDARLRRHPVDILVPDWWS